MCNNYLSSSSVNDNNTTQLYQRGFMTHAAHIIDIS